jgi:hypothetical protein
MKIGLVCPYNIFKNGGVQECVLALRAEYERRGHQAYIITPRPRGVEVAETPGIPFGWSISRLAIATSYDSTSFGNV